MRSAAVFRSSSSRRRRAAARPAARPFGAFTRLERRGHACRQGVGVPGVDEDARVAEDLGQRPGPVGHDRQAGRQGLDRGNAEALVLGGEDHDVGASEQLCQ